MRSKFYRYLSPIPLLAFFVIASWSTTPGHTSTAATPPGIVRIAGSCGANPPNNCNDLDVGAIARDFCQLPATFDLNVVGGSPRLTPPLFIISVTDPDGNPVPVTITSPDGRAATFEGRLAGIYGLTVEDRFCQTHATNCLPMTVPCCSLKQEEYGNCAGVFDSCDTLNVVKALGGTSNIPSACQSLIVFTTTPPFIGMPSAGLRSLTFAFGAERCLIDKLPASGDPAALPPGLGDAVITSPTSPSTCQLPADCAFPATLPINSAGKFGNALIGQTMALSLNVRLDDIIRALTIASAMITQKALPDSHGFLGSIDNKLDPGPDGILGTTDDPITIVTIPGPVISAIAANSPLEMAGKFADNEPRDSVARVLKLANLVLAGEQNLGVTALEINAAVAAINRAFDRCGFVIKSFNADLSLQDDNGLLVFNSTTGEYVFSRCGPDAFSITGSGTLTRKGCTLTLQRNLSDRRILVTVDTCQRRGTASVQLLSRGMTFTISDNNTANNLGACP